MRNRNKASHLTPKSKSPILAAALNLIPIPIALGYAYLGRWKQLFIEAGLRLGAPIAGALTFGILSIFIDHILWFRFDNLFTVTAGWALPIIAVVIHSAIDARNIADQINQPSDQFSEPEKHGELGTTRSKRLLSLASPPALRTPLAAAALNLIPLPFAFGYASLGHWGRFRGAIVLRAGAVAVGAMIVLFYALGCTSSAECPETETMVVFGVAALIPIASLVFSAIDAYRLAKRHD